MMPLKLSEQRGGAFVSLWLAMVLGEHITEEVVFKLDFEERLGHI